MKKFNIEIASVPDKDNLVAEIWCENILIAELSHEAEEIDIEFYINDTIKFNLKELIEIFEEARKKMLQL